MNKITTTILAFCISQSISTAYAEFTQKDFKGDFGGTFSGPVSDVDPVSGIVTGEAGSLTFTHIGHSDGMTYSGYIIANWLEEGLNTVEGHRDDFNCPYNVDPDGHVHLDCALVDDVTRTFEGTAELHCVIILPRNILVPHIQGDLDCTGTVRVRRDPSDPASDFLIANVEGNITHRLIR